MELIAQFMSLLLLVTPVPAEPGRASGLPITGTGVTSWGDQSRNNLGVPQPAFPRQDADSSKAFSLTKIDARGNSLPENASVWQCVRDNITGLTWEGKTDDSGLHGKDHTYSWYSTNEATNGGRAGMAGSREDTTCGMPITIAGGCDTEKFVDAVNAAGLCGFRDWRLPTIEELGSIVNYGRSMPAIDSVYFPNMPQPAGFWSATPFAPESSFAWIVVFDEGGISHCVKSWAYHVRLVRGGK